MGLKAMILLWVLITAVLAQGELSINDYNIRNNWPTMENYISKQRVLRLYDEDLSENSMLKVLSLELPLLEDLHFSYQIPPNHPAYRDITRAPQVLTHTLVEAIFKSRFFPRLRVLDLRSTNIDDRYLAFLEGLNLTTSVSVLILDNCLIGRAGYQHLSRVRFTNLTQLNVSNTLLAEGEAVDALIAIICGPSAGSCSNNLEGLDLSESGIQREHFIRLMWRINPGPLRSLNLRKLSLTYKQTYKEGSNYSAFEVLAERFSSLEYLELQDAMVDDEIATIFQNWTLHSLILLNVAKNHLSDEGVKLWINKKNMPNLEVLALHSNEVGDGAVAHLIDEEYEFTKFFFGDCRVTAAGVKRLSELPSDRLEKLLLQVHIPSQTLNDFFEQGNFLNLRELTIISNDLLTGIFEKISWGKLRKLQTLTFSYVNFKDSLARALESFENRPLSLFPSLEFLILSEPQLDDEMVGLLLITLPAFFPRLRELIVIQEAQLDESRFMATALASSNFNEGMYININGLELAKRSNQFDLIAVTSLNFLFFSENREDFALEAIYSKIPAIVQAYDFSTLTDITIESKMMVDYFFRALGEAKITTLGRLRSLTIQRTVDVDFLVSQMGEVEMPGLRELALSLVIAADAEENYIEKVLRLFDKFKHLTALLLNVAFLNEENGFLMKKQLLDRLRFPYLTQIIMNNQNMEVQEIAQLIRNHNQTLRGINMGNNFMETEFLSILVEEGIVLRQLSLESTSFVVDEFAIMGRVNTQFLAYLDLSQSDLTNEHVLAMLAQNKTGPFFPKLYYLNLESNDIRKEGLSALLATGMHNLLTLNLDRNSNPQYINIMLTYPTRIVFLEASNVETYGLQDDLDPSSTINIKGLVLKTQSFLREDFLSLARLSFSTLKEGTFEIYNAYDCGVLADLLRVNRWAKAPQFIFNNDERGLNSSCLAETVFESQVLGLSIQDTYGTTYLHEFAERVLNTSQEIKVINLVNTRLPPDFFVKIFKHSFSQLQALAIQSNYIGDAAIREFFKKSFQNLVYLGLQNADIGDATVQAMSHSKMPELKLLLLDENNLGVKAIRAIQKMASGIYIISLKRCGLDGEALQALGQLTSDKLAGLMLSHNDFTGTDLLNFVSNLERKSLPQLAYLELEGIELTKEEHDAITAVLTPKSIKVKMDAPHNIAKVNSAFY